MQRNNKPTSLQANAPLLWRVFAFLMVFVITSGVIGPRIIGNGLVNKYGFEIYGGAGKALLFGTVALLLLVSKKGGLPTLKPWRRLQALWLAAAALALYAGWFAVGKLIVGAHGAAWPLAVHLCLLATVAFAALGTFGPTNIRVLAKAYRRELLAATALAVGFYAFLYAVYGLWQVLATIVLHASGWLLGVSGVHAVAIPPDTLLLNRFAIEISKYCSGIDSIALFSGLYAVVGLVDWQRFDHKKYLSAFLLALAVLFGCNILRVYVLIMAGYYINPHIAFSLFHTYAGMVFFIIYSAVFWSVSYKWMLRPQAAREKIQ